MEREDFYNPCISEREIITNAFNNYFLNVRKTLSKSIVSTGDPLSYVTSNLTIMFVPSIQVIEILYVMSLLNNSTAEYDDPTAIHNEDVNQGVHTNLLFEKNYA